MKIIHKKLGVTVLLFWIYSVICHSHQFSYASVAIATKYESQHSHKVKLDILKCIMTSRNSSLMQKIRSLKLSNVELLFF